MSVGRYADPCTLSRLGGACIKRVWRAIVGTLSHFIEVESFLRPWFHLMRLCVPSFAMRGSDATLAHL